MEEQQISEHVVVLRGAEGGTYPHGNPLRITGADTTVQVDSSLGSADRDSGAGSGPQVCADLLLLSHYHEDHVVGLGDTGVPVAIHRRDLPAVQSWDAFCRYMNVPDGTIGDDLRREFRWSELPRATAFDDDAVFDLGGGVTVRAVPLPGHTGGHCGFFVEPDGVFYLADVDLMSFGPVYADLESTLPDTRASLARCAELDAAVYATFHHKGHYTDRTEYLTDLSRHTAALDAREHRLRALLSASDAPLTARDLLGKGVVYRVGGRRPWYADAVEQVMIEAHLAELAARDG